MGNTESLWQKICSAFYRNIDVKILMIGLDGAGKTSILYKLKLGEVVTTIPTIGFNVETVAYKRINFTTWDVGNRSGSRGLIRHYFQGTEVVMFVVDSCDHERMDECREELHSLMCEDELKDCCLLVMANKQDLPNALSLEEVRDRLDLNKLPPTKAWHIEGTCATNGNGLYEGLSWLQSQLTTKQLKKSVSQPTTEVKDSLTGKNGFLSSCFSSFSKYYASKDTLADSQS